MFLDIGLGILSAVFITRYTPLALNGSVVSVAVLFALLPDADFLLHGITHGVGKFSHAHRNLLHNPLIYIPIGLILIVMVIPQFTILFLLCSVAHFLHDSVGMGWGVRWWYPFSRRSYKFFSDKTGRASNTFVTSWTSEEQGRAATQFGDPHWFAHYWRSRELVIELAVLCVALFVLWRA